MTARVLAACDEAVLETFLAAHRDSSMFLRSNARQAGLEYRGQPLQAVYVGAFRPDALAGVVAHAWNDVLLIQAPDDAAELARACVDVSGRSVGGLMGPSDQVREARSALGLNDRSVARDGGERLYALDLKRFDAGAFSRDGIVCRPPLSDERDALLAWRMAYDVETLGASDTVEQRRRSAEFLDRQIAEHNAWVAVERGRLLSLSAFNAALPDIVQLGGIYTPPELRGRGYAKIAVAASLGVARARGATRAVLFTGNPSAERTYRALGFQYIGEYSLVFFR